MNQQTLGDFIWNVADSLRGPFRPSLYGRIILPFTVLRRLECVLSPPAMPCATGTPRWPAPV